MPRRDPRPPTTDPKPTETAYPMGAALTAGMVRPDSPLPKIRTRPAHEERERILKENAAKNPYPPYPGPEVAPQAESESWGAVKQQAGVCESADPIAELFAGITFETIEERLEAMRRVREYVWRNADEARSEIGNMMGAENSRLYQRIAKLETRLSIETGRHHDDIITFCKGDL